jgi:hypothetical protein
MTSLKGTIPSIGPIQDPLIFVFDGVEMKDLKGLSIFEIHPV